MVKALQSRADYNDTPQTKPNYYLLARGADIALGGVHLDNSNEPWCTKIQDVEKFVQFLRRGKSPRWYLLGR
jgi:hypothetical protein